MADELAEINGIKPKVLLLDGEEKEVSSMSRPGGTRCLSESFLCLNGFLNIISAQSGSPVNARTCKHLKSLFGDTYEEARLKLKNPNGPPPKGVAKKPPPKAKAQAKPVSKRKKADDDEDVAKTAKRARKTASAFKTALKDRGKAEKEDNEDEDEDDTPAATKAVPELLLANKWDLETGLDPVGWWISEKLDGVSKVDALSFRTYYDGKQMISRLGNPFTPPQWFLDKLPNDVTLDGELFGGRGEFQSTISIVKTVNSPLWKNITFQVTFLSLNLPENLATLCPQIFDIPSMGDSPFEKRIQFLKELFGPGGSHACDLVEIVEHEMATSRQHVLDKLKEIESLGGEGLMLRKPASQYDGKRSGSLLKVKTFYDAEAVVTGYVPGKGRNQGTTGALKCKMESGKVGASDLTHYPISLTQTWPQTFNVGTGLNDKQRNNPPKVGAIITYRFQELTKDGVPRFPSYIGEAVDKDEPKDAEIPEHRKGGTKPTDADD
ncbi:hypothetical protein D9615_003941 [Tricholomella constricta]|uniref:DNA ligase n=1 Tax=Tricholomella constricta TaxID=117010 RepID=A0A8H5HDD7_9AGAR|nr:hypothetical protein D9615_003941 [Tricholomella constricta]